MASTDENIMRKITRYCNERKSIVSDKNIISAFDLIEAVKDYYKELHDIYDENSNTYAELLDEINGYLSPEYVSLLKKRNSNYDFKQIRRIVRDSIGKMINSNYNLRGIKCDDIKIAIRHDITAIRLGIHENYELKPIIICRDIEDGRLFLAKNSNSNDKLLEQLRAKLFNIFDMIDSYRATLPSPDQNNDLTDDCFNGGCNAGGTIYESAFGDEMFNGNVRVNARGKVTYKLIMNDGFELQDTINVDEILKRIEVDVESLKDPIKSIAISSFEREYALIDGEMRRI